MKNRRILRCERWKNASERQRKRLNAEVQSSQRIVMRWRKSHGSPIEGRQPRGFCLYFRLSSQSQTGERARTRLWRFFRLIFATVKWRVRRGLSGEASLGDVKEGMRGGVEYAAKRFGIGICDGMD